MRKFITAGLAALTLAGGIAASSTADARPHGGRHGGSGAAVAAGIAGLAIGAALASDHDRYRHHRYGYDRDYGYYRDGYFYGPPARAYGYYDGRGYYDRRRCVTRTVWDPYWGEYTQRTRCWR